MEWPAATWSNLLSALVGGALVFISGMFLERRRTAERKQDKRYQELKDGYASFLSCAGRIITAVHGHTWDACPHRDTLLEALQVHSDVIHLVAPPASRHLAQQLVHRAERLDDGEAFFEENRQAFIEAYNQFFHHVRDELDRLRA